MLLLPVVSLAGLASEDLAERQALARRLGAVCREVGFFYLVDHGVPEAIVQTAFRGARQFFELPLAHKERLSIRRSLHNRGYVAMADERLDPDAGSDQKEAFNIGVELPADHPDVVASKPFRGLNFWPELPGFRQDMLAHFAACLALGRQLHRLFALDLGVEECFFTRHLTNPIATLRLLRYPGGPGDDARHDAGAGTHTDYGNVTLLATDGVAGLEVASRSGEWIDAPSIAGAFVCNIGDCLMRWSNDLYVSTPHRVRQPLRERYSIAFFLEVNPDSMVDARDIFPNQPAKYPPIDCATYLASRLDATYGYRSRQSRSSSCFRD
jgi:isopenicillin N synthase-like dioxygenase